MNGSLFRIKVGFTLMEVYVSLVILSTGTLAIGHMFDGFNRLVAAERLQAGAFGAAVRQMENAIADPPSCGSVNPVSPYVKLFWFEVIESPGVPARSVRFRRLIPCR